MKLYVLVADGYTGDYGSENYLVGVYDNREDAELNLAKVEKLHGDYPVEASILEVELNTTYPLTKEESMYPTLDLGFGNDLYIGGYVEG